jgi:hypothetical protein
MQDGARNERGRIMNEHNQNRNKEAAEGTGMFAMPDCCGPMMCADNEEKVTNGRSVCAEMMNKMSEGENPMESCPMSAMFKKTSGKRGFGLLAMIPGLLLVLGGVAIILEPQILVWLMATTSIVAGLMLLAAATFFRRLAADLRNSEV